MNGRGRRWAEEDNRERGRGGATWESPSREGGLMVAKPRVKVGVLGGEAHSD